MTSIKAALEQEKAMGRRKELTQEERQDLLAKGYRPIEIWVPDLENEAVRKRMEEEIRRIVEADEKEGISDWIAAVGPTDWDKP
jgi:hypothetical protein